MLRTRSINKKKEEGKQIMPKQDKADQDEPLAGPVKGDFIAPPEMTDVDDRTDALP